MASHAGQSYSPFYLQSSSSVTSLDMGIYACVAVDNNGIGLIQKSLLFMTIDTTGSSVVVAGCTSVTAIKADSSVYGLQAFGAGAGDFVGNLVIDSGNGTGWTFLDANADYIGDVTDNVFPDSSGLTAATNFYIHPDGNTNTLATFNGYTDNSGNAEVDTSVSGEYVPSVLTMIDTPAGMHTDYYGNPLGPTMAAGAVQRLPSVVSSLFARSTFLLLGL